MKAFNASFTLASEEGTEVSDITKLVRDIVQNSPVTTGIALINTLHNLSHAKKPVDKPAVQRSK